MTNPMQYVAKHKIKAMIADTTTALGGVKKRTNKYEHVVKESTWNPWLLFIISIKNWFDYCIVLHWIVTNYVPCP